MYLYLTYKEADFLCSIPLIPVGHAKQHHVLEQQPPLMHKEACAIFLHLSLQDRTEVGSLSFLKSSTDLHLVPYFLSLTLHALNNLLVEWFSAQLLCTLWRVSQNMAPVTTEWQ